MIYRGGVTERMLHHNYQLKIGDLNGSHTQTLVAHDEEGIVGFIPRIPRGEWIKELARKKVSVTDFNSENPEIEILVGNDYEGMLMTGRIESLECGVTAIQYVWGWALSGKRPEGVNTAAVSLSLLSCQESVTPQRSRKSLDIATPAEVKSKTERKVDTSKRFRETVMQNKERRYSVRLPRRVENPNGTIEEKEVAKKVTKSLGVEKLVTLVDTVGELAGNLEDLREKATRILASGKMELRQWECGLFFCSLPSQKRWED
ncbi:hypothetical protein Fcan01_14437 [Folsomia candida]|uniref:Uncharacterized protein n=1 Tax=Folsomia candida TaxID=158441 RepID=A0A226E0P1_FOLCA|nr:hypothetical protein Fcan01_14437 [Folsomia candida]